MFSGLPFVCACRCVYIRACSTRVEVFCSWLAIDFWLKPVLCAAYDTTDVRSLESQLEQVRRRRDDARDPLLHQLRGVIEMLQQQQLSADPQQTRLASVVDSLQQTTTQLASNNSQLEAAVLTKINE